MDSKNTPNRQCEMLAAEIIKPIENFLNSFQKALETSGSNITPEFLVNFLTAADRLNNQCSQNVTWLLLEHSQHAEVRASSEATLVRLIRGRCLETLDLILENYAGYLAQVSPNLNQTVQRLSESRLRNALLGTEDPSGAKVRQFKLPTGARSVALLNILEYCANLKAAADSLADYGSHKLGTNTNDTGELSRAVVIVQAALEEPLGKVLHLIENHEIIKRKRWEEQHAKESVTLTAIMAVSTGKLHQRKSLTGSLVLSLLFAAPVWYILSSGTTNLYIGAAAAVCAIVAIVFFLRMITVIAKDN